MKIKYNGIVYDVVEQKNGSITSADGAIFFGLSKDDILFGEVVEMDAEVVE